MTFGWPECECVRVHVCVFLFVCVTGEQRWSGSRCFVRRLLASSPLSANSRKRPAMI